MDEDYLNEVRELFSKNYTLDEIKSILSKKGLLDSDIDMIISSAISNIKDSSIIHHKKQMSLVAYKELLDKIAYGLVSHPFVNILFFLSGASYFLIGLINGLRMIISLFLSSFLKEFSRVQVLSKHFIRNAGIIYGFSFLFMSFAVVLKSPPLYAVAFLVGGIGVVAHGEVYTDFLKKNTKREHSSGLLIWLAKYGILVMIISMLVSGYIIDMFPGDLVSFSLFGHAFSFNIYGYLISFELTALLFIISGLIFSYIKQSDFLKEHTFATYIGKFFVAAKVHKSLFSKKAVLLLTIASLITGLVQVIGNSFYGIFIYNEFKNSYLGGFTNVAVVFAVAATFSLLGPWLTRKLKRHIGVSPMLVFGTLLSAMLPLSLSFNPIFPVIIVASALSIIGSSILGMAHTFFAKSLLSVDERQIYFSFIGFVLVIPLIIFVPLMSYFAQLDLTLLFKIITGVLVLLATPIYFSMVLLFEKHTGEPVFF